ncbi:unnamed protein product [Schistocephalus solidus]|uniref:Uncharacterized protein n=1 Tax=Schistocephalus solidus TaxID=70667 RepID=A0A183TRA1_SCHSO|nr:unnamed protein product [Schistocephalus solidus]
MLLWPPLTGTQLSPVAPRSWVLPSDHTSGNRHDRRAKPGEGLRCCVRLHTRSNRPERRTALVTHKLARYKVDIAALSENRFSEQGQLEELGTGYTFFWSGQPTEERRDVGVAFANRNDIVGRLPCLPQGFNDHLMRHRLPLRNQITEKLEDLFAPDDNATVETLWYQLRNVIQSTAPEVFGHARHQHQDWFEDNDADISNLLTEKNRLHTAFKDLRTDVTKAAFFRCHRLLKQRLKEMQDASMI